MRKLRDYRIPPMVDKSYASRAILVCCSWTFISIGLTLALTASALAQTDMIIGEGVSGDVSHGVQMDDNGQPTGLHGGVTVKPGDKVSFDDAGKLISSTAGYWKGEEGKTYSCIYKDAESTWYGLFEIKGPIIRWDRNRNVTEGKENFLRITNISDRTHNFLTITEHKLINGRLSIKTERGTRFLVYDLSPDCTVKIKKIRSR